MRMFRWARGKTRLDHSRNEDIRKEAHVKPVERSWKTTKLKWFGHCLKREPNHICAKSLRLDVSGEKEQRSAEKEMEEQHKGRFEEIPTD